MWRPQIKQRTALGMRSRLTRSGAVRESLDQRGTPWVRDRGCGTGSAAGRMPAPQMPQLGARERLAPLWHGLCSRTGLDTGSPTLL